MTKPEPLTDEQIEEHRELWLTTKHGSVNVTEAQIFARAIEAAVNERWEAMLSKQEPVAWWIPKAEQFCLPPKDGTRPFAKQWQPLYAAPQPAQQEPAKVKLIERLRDTASKGVSVWGDLQMEAANALEAEMALSAMRKGLADGLLAKVKSLKAQPAQQEPVAWVEQEWRGSGLKHLHFERREPTVRDEVVCPVWTPLYAAPQPAQQEPVTCGNGCNCLTQCGDYYEHAGLPKPAPMQVMPSNLTEWDIRGILASKLKF